MQQLSPTSHHRVLIVGYGDLGKKIANALVLDQRFEAIGVTARNAEQVERDANLLRFTAMNHGYRGDVSGHVVDLQDPASTLAALEEFEPSMVVNCATVQSWRRLTELPPRTLPRARRGTVRPVAADASGAGPGAQPGGARLSR